MKSEILKIPVLHYDPGDEYEVIDVLVEVNERVVLDQPLFTVETSKATVEIPSPVSGIVAEVLIQPGDIIPQGKPAVRFRGPIKATQGIRTLARKLGIPLDRVVASGPEGRIVAADLNRFSPSSRNSVDVVEKTTTNTNTKIVVSVATEWLSKHGGLSTFNREMCAACVRSGYRVFCLVPRADSDEFEDAKLKRVELIPAVAEPGLTDRARLCLPPELPHGLCPELIIGHDRITGPIARVIVKYHFPDASNLLFIHTSPWGIEWDKYDDQEVGPAYEAEQRERLQLELAEHADLIAAVGPRLHRSFATALTGSEIPLERLYRFDPGLGEFPGERDPPKHPECLLLARAEDDSLKGLDIAARALGCLYDRGLVGGESPTLIIRGAKQGSAETLRSKLKDISKNARVKINVKEYTSELQNIRRDMLRASLVLMPSREEGFGLVGMEAISLGVPVLLSDQSGVAELLQDSLPEEAKEIVVGVSGELESDAEEWERKISFVLEDRPAAFLRAFQLRERLEKLASWDKAVRGLLDQTRRLATY